MMGTEKPRSGPVCTHRHLTFGRRERRIFGEIFYIIKNSIRFTGMPGWGGEGDENWKLVVFIRHLPHLTEQELESMRKINRIEEEGKAGHHH